MNIEQAKAIAIAEILEKLELKAIKEDKIVAVYPSPFNKNENPVLTVYKRDNIWYDTTRDIGGDAFDLVREILKSRGHQHDDPRVIQWFKNTGLDPSQPKLRDPVKGKKSKWKLIAVDKLEDLALFRYLKQRGINITLAKKYVCEVYVRRKCSLTKTYAIGFENEDGGFDFQNPFFKGCVAPRTITFIRADKPKPDGVVILKDCLDFLSYVTVQNGKLPHDVIVLNSAACVDHAFRYIKNYGYKAAYTWLGNDKAGTKAVQRLTDLFATEPGLIHKPQNNRYEDHRDINAWLMHTLLKKPAC